MIPIRDLFESHLTVANLQRSMAFFGGVLGFELAEVFPERKVAFYWIGGRDNSMLGLWEVGSGPQRLSLHLAFRSDLVELLQAPATLLLHFSGRLGPLFARLTRNLSTRYLAIEANGLRKRSEESTALHVPASDLDNVL